MFAFLIAGLSFGLSAGFSPGPLFAMVISQTVRHGLKEGLKTALAPLITDLPIILLTTFLLSGLQNYKTLLGLISLTGGIFLCFLAYGNLRLNTANITPASEAKNSIFKGALVNALSPHPYLFWLMVGGPMLVGAYEQGLGSAFCFIFSFYASLVGAKIALAFIVNRSRDFLLGKTYTYLMRALGIVLLLFACQLFKDALKLTAP